MKNSIALILLITFLFITITFTFATTQNNDNNGVGFGFGPSGGFNIPGFGPGIGGGYGGGFGGPKGGYGKGGTIKPTMVCNDKGPCFGKKLKCPRKITLPFSLIPMESSEKKQVGSASTKQSSTGIFSSIFPPPSKVMGRKASAAELIQSLEKQSSGCRAWNKLTPADVTKNKEGAGHCRSSKEHESLFQDRGEPCPLSSSLFYGGQEDMYIKSSDAHKTVSYLSYKKEGGEYDSSGNNLHTASRGNWWQGSLYY